MSLKRKTDKALNGFGNFMGKTRENLREVERAPEYFVKGYLKGAVGATKLAGDVSTGVLKEMSGIVAYGVREATGQKKRKGPYKSNLAKGWFE